MFIDANAKCSYCRNYRICLNGNRTAGEEADLTLPYLCDFYKPRTVNHCHFCGEIINQPRHSWLHWVKYRERKLAVCSPYCRREFIKNHIKNQTLKE